MRENEVLADLITRHAEEHEAKLAGLVLHHDSKRIALFKEQVRLDDKLAKQKGDALAEVQSWKVALYDARNGAIDVEAERDELWKERQSLRKQRDAARAEARGLQVDLANVQRTLKNVTRDDIQAPRTTLALCCAKHETVRKVDESVRKENESVRKEHESVRTEVDSVREENESVRRKADALRKELERARGTAKMAIFEAKWADCAHARARKELESALTSLAELQRGRARLQRELADALEALDGVKRHHATAENTARERLAALEEEVRRVTSAGTPACVEMTSAGGGSWGSQAANGGADLHRPPAATQNAIGSGDGRPGPTDHGKDGEGKEGVSVLSGSSLGQGPLCLQPNRALAFCTLGRRGSGLVRPCVFSSAWSPCHWKLLPACYRAIRGPNQPRRYRVI